MLVEWGKYKEAIPELERAISLARDDVNLRLSLGRAHLSLGDTQKSMAAFEEAVKLDRSPEVLNDVAYFLAEEGVQLDKAPNTQNRQ